MISRKIAMTPNSEKIRITVDDLSSPQQRVNCPSGWRRWRVTGSSPVVQLLLGLGATLLVVAMIAGWWARVPPRPWLERVAATEDSSIVRLSNADRTGTGFVIASHKGRALILTNRHVISESQGLIFTVDEPQLTCRVTLRSGDELTGQLVALPKDDNIDLALLVVDSSSLRPLGRICDFAQVRQGERVAAVGHPFGFAFHITSGIVSSKQEGLYLLTDASINPGNSGGPLVDEEMAIVGVNTFHIGDGIGAAVRADYIRRTADWTFLGDVSELLNGCR
jgi:S1-C subfamily serine protease